MAKKKPFPQTLYVRMEEDRDDGWHPWAFENEAAAIDDDGPTEVAVYELRGVETLSKKVERRVTERRPPKAV